MCDCYNLACGVVVDMSILLMVLCVFLFPKNLVGAAMFVSMFRVVRDYKDCKNLFICACNLYIYSCFWFLFMLIIVMIFN